MARSTVPATTGPPPSRWSTRSTPPAGGRWPTPTTSTDWDGGKRLVDTAIEAFGDLHVLVNNAGILRDRVLVNMSEADWDSVIEVHLKGHFVPTRHAAAYWREQSKAGREVKASVVNTSSTSGLARQPGPVQLRRGQGRHRRLHHHRRRRADPLRGAGERHRPGRPHPDDRTDTGAVRHRRRPGWTPRCSTAWDPANVSPLVAYLATEQCPSTGKVYFVQGGQIRLFRPWTMSDDILEKKDRWTVAELEAQMYPLVG